MCRDLNIAEAWRQSDNGRGFVAALKDKGYTLAQGRKRLVVVDKYGQTHNPVRHLENVRSKQFNERVADLDLTRLPDATELSRKIQADNKRRYERSRRHDEQVAQQKNQMQTRHQEQRTQMSHCFEDRLTREREELNQHYRLDEQQAQIDTLREKTKNPNWWKRLLGISKKDRARLNELELTHQNAQWRAQERLDRITAEREKSLALLKERQEAEKRLELEQLHTQKPADYINEAEREKIAHHLRDRDRNRSGPSLER
jgi:hypothetical protein